MKILILDPFYEDSHRAWAEGLKKHSTHHVEVLSLSPHHWKWRMTGGAIELAERYKQLDYSPDLILATDMLDFAAFISLSGIDRSSIATAIYFHENQITYPWTSPSSELQKEKNHHYGFINFSSCLVADKIYFNSQFHHRSFLERLPSFLKIFPRFGHQKYVDAISQKSSVLPIGMDLKTSKVEKSYLPCFLWNHRWEYDKSPGDFFNTLLQLQKEGVEFELIVLGKSYERQPPIFEEAKELLKEKIIHYGYVESTEEYKRLMGKANILLVTSHQDFFGISIVEAIAAGLFPVLPDRLAYPEHIPTSKHEEYLYQNELDIIPMLKDIITQKKYLARTELPNFVEKYDWQNLIKKYDVTLAEINS